MEYRGIYTEFPPENGKRKIKVAFQNQKPIENAVTYKIETIKDIFNCITEENIEGFLLDFEIMLRQFPKMKEKGMTHLTEFTWTDDWKPGQALFYKGEKDEY